LIQWLKSDLKSAQNSVFQTITFPTTFTNYPYISCTLNTGGAYWSNVQWLCGSTHTTLKLETWLIGTTTADNICFDILALGF